jgi:hypothetical protein
MKHKHKQLLFKTYKHTICSIKKELIFKVRRILDLKRVCELGQISSPKLYTWGGFQNLVTYID